MRPTPKWTPPLLLNQALCPLACPLETVQSIIVRCLVQQDVVQDLALPERQSLRDGPPLGGQKGIETAMKEKIEPMLQGVPVNLLVPAHSGQGFPVPDRLQGQQPPSLTLCFMPIVKLLP